MRNAARRWFKFHNVGTSPCRRLAHAMASHGTRVFVLGGYSADARSDEISLVHVFDTSMYFHSVFTSGQSPRSRTQRTSSTRSPNVTLSISSRRPLNLRGSHPYPRPRSNHRTWGPFHWNATVLSVCKMLPPLHQADLPPYRLGLLTSEAPVRMVIHWNSRV